MHRKSRPVMVSLRAAHVRVTTRLRATRVQATRAMRPRTMRVQASRLRAMHLPIMRAGAIRLAAGLTKNIAGWTSRPGSRPRPRHLATATADRRVAAGLVFASLVTVGIVAGGVAVASPPHHRAQAVAGVGHQVRSGRASVRPAQPASKVAAAMRPRPWVSPMPGVPLSSCFGPRWGTLHQGIDFAGDSGTTIRAVGAGTVFGAGWLYSGYGISVVIDHGNGYFSHYAHMSRALVRPGQRVRPGQPIGREGSTGDSTGPHLHFEIHHGMWHQINPAPWLRAHGVHSAC
jgi:murein DD-endopeptidase MepM/ murein hydrolase activator NlpD